MIKQHEYDLHRKPPSTMGHESVIQRRPSLSHPGWLKYFFQTDLPLKVSLSSTNKHQLYVGLVRGQRVCT